MIPVYFYDYERWWWRQEPFEAGVAWNPNPDGWGWADYTPMWSMRLP